MKLVEAKRLDEKGRCCGCKPISYKRPTPHFFCHRCCADFDHATGRQIPNFAYSWHDSTHFDDKRVGSA